MVGLHQIFEAINDGIVEAFVQIGLEADYFTKTFSPMSQDIRAAEKKEEILSIILLVIGVVAVLTFEAAVSQMAVR